MSGEIFAMFGAPSFTAIRTGRMPIADVELAIAPIASSMPIESVNQVSASIETAAASERAAIRSRSHTQRPSGRLLVCW